MFGLTVQNRQKYQQQPQQPREIHCMVFFLLSPFVVYAAFCSTGASLSLSRDGRFLALTDGCTLLLLDAAAAANAEAPTPHRGHLSSTVGLLRVSDCPTTPGEPSGSSQGGNPEGPPAYLGDSYQGVLEGSRAAVAIRCVRRVLRATHSNPQFRR